MSTRSGHSWPTTASTSATSCSRSSVTTGKAHMRARSRRFTPRPMAGGIVIAEDGDPGSPSGPGATILGYVAWGYDPKASHGTIELLAVGREHRGCHVATTLCQHALDNLRACRARTVDVGTGGDAFHAPARGLLRKPRVHRRVRRALRARALSPATLASARPVCSFASTRVALSNTRTPNGVSYADCAHSVAEEAG